jgi:hypothetical protein
MVVLELLLSQSGILLRLDPGLSLLLETNGLIGLGFQPGLFFFPSLGTLLRSDPR